MTSRSGISTPMGKTSVSTSTDSPGIWTADGDSGVWITDRDSWALSPITAPDNSEGGFSLFTDARSPEVVCADSAPSENAGNVQQLLIENQRLRLEIARMNEEIEETASAWLATHRTIGDARRFLSCFLPPDPSSADPDSRTRVRVQGTIDQQVVCMRDFFGYFVHPEKVGAPLPHFNEPQY